MNKFPLRPASTAIAASMALLLVSCSGIDGADDANGGTVNADGSVTVENCGEEMTYPADPSMLAYDSGIISIALAAGAGDNLSAVASIGKAHDTLAAKYGADVIDGFDVISDKQPTLEQVVSLQPDIYFAGWNYGLSEGLGVTPDLLDQRDIATYLLTESCRQEGTDQRGLVEPWEALDIDLRNIGAIAGDSELAESVIDDIDHRLKKLNDAPQPEQTPTLFVFDSGTDAVFTSGKFGAPQAIIETAGARNQTEDLADSWVQVGWESLAADAPDAFVFVDYEGQSLEDKIKILKNHPLTRDLPAVKEDRFINLNYSMWVSSPLNIDAAEHVRKGLEKFGLVPESDIEPAMTLPESLDGREYFTR